MLTTSLIYDRQPNRSAPSSRSSACSHVTKSPVAHPLSIQQFTKCFFSKSFVLKTIHLSWGVYPGVYPRVYPPLGSAHDSYSINWSSYSLSSIPFFFIL